MGKRTAQTRTRLRKMQPLLAPEYRGDHVLGDQIQQVVMACDAARIQGAFRLQEVATGQESEERVATFRRSLPGRAHGKQCFP